VRRRDGGSGLGLDSLSCEGDAGDFIACIDVMACWVKFDTGRLAKS
jgi:hypothetical protein